MNHLNAWVLLIHVLSVAVISMYRLIHASRGEISAPASRFSTQLIWVSLPPWGQLTWWDIKSSRPVVTYPMIELILTTRVTFVSFPSRRALLSCASQTALGALPHSTARYGRLWQEWFFFIFILTLVSWKNHKQILHLWGFKLLWNVMF